MTESHLLLAGQDISECCKKTVPGQNDDALLHKLQTLIADHSVKLALVGDEWYRLGGVVDMAGQRVAHDLTEWVERTYLECGQNLQTLIEHALEQQLIATRQTGKTLYFVVQTGDRAEDFHLIEIDKTHEVADRLLVSEQNPPEDLEEFIDPLHPFCVEPFGFGHSRYQYRRKTDVKLFMESVNQRQVGEHPVQRFIDDWNRSSAGLQHRMSDYWIIRPSQHTGRYGERVLNAEIASTRQTTLPNLQEYSGKKGSTLAGELNRFDRQAGYPLAWFFCMLKGGQVSADYAEAAFRDIAGEYAYLPKRDEAVLRDWIASPYR